MSPEVFCIKKKVPLSCSAARALVVRFTYFEAFAINSLSLKVAKRRFYDKPAFSFRQNRIFLLPAPTFRAKPRAIMLDSMDEPP